MLQRRQLGFGGSIQARRTSGGRAGDDDDNEDHGGNEDDEDNDDNEKNEDDGGRGRTERGRDAGVQNVDHARVRDLVENELAGLARGQSSSETESDEF